MGTGRNRLIRQMLTEVLLLGVGGGCARIALAKMFLRLLQDLDPGNIPRLQQGSLDGRVLAFALAIMIITSVLTSLPAFSHHY